MFEIIKMKFGSHVYGTATEHSDTDYKAVFIPPAQDLIYGNPLEAIVTNTKQDQTLKNGAADVDSEYYSLKKYMKLLLEGQTVAIDMFFTPEEFYQGNVTGIWMDIQRMKPDWLHKSITPFVGYCMRQAAKYGVKGSRVAAARKAMDFFGEKETHLKLSSFWDEIVDHFSHTEHCSIIMSTLRGNPMAEVRMLDVCDRKVQEHIKAVDAYKIYQKVFKEYGARALQAETNEGVDWKAMSHAVRIADQAIELLKTENIIFPRHNADYLLKIKKGQLQYKDVADHLEQLLLDLQQAQQDSMLPEMPNHAWAHMLVTANYANYIVTQILPGFTDYEKVDRFINRCYYAKRL